jgi:hypothetical protein
MGKIHYITFASGNNRFNGLPYSDTQKMLVDSIQSQTKREVILHTYDLESLSKLECFSKIANWPIKYPDPWGRDGFYNVYKVIIANDIIDKIDDGDFIYYTDSSAYIREPFLQNIDRLFKYADYNGHVCGSAGTDVKHNSFHCCDKKEVWDCIWPEVSDDFKLIMHKSHILASWYLFKKNDKSIKFIKEWAHYCTKLLNDKPLCTYHHTVDQSIFNILVYKHNMRVFFNNNKHDHNKNHNNVHIQLNKLPNDDLEELKKWFVNPIYINLISL